MSEPKPDLGDAPATALLANLGAFQSFARKQLRERLEQTCRVCASHGCLDCTCDTHS